MKYKVIIMEDNGGGSSPDIAAPLSFYTRQAAVNCASQWNEAGLNRFAWLFDGASWTIYNG